jgi:hypothetical protein
MSQQGMIYQIEKLLEEIKSGQVRTMTVIVNSSKVYHLAKIEYSKETSHSDIVFDCERMAERYKRKIK